MASGRDLIARTELPLAVVVSAGGMGMAAARRLGQHHRLLIVDLRAERAEAAAATLRAEGSSANWAACDITKSEDIAALSEAIDRVGGFRVLAHVAGLSPSLGDFATIVRVNLTGAAAVADMALRHAAPGAAAILVSSMSAHIVSPTEEVKALLRAPHDPGLAEKLAGLLGADGATPQAAYPLSKWGLMAYCRNQAAAWGARGGRIVSLSPGMIATPQGALEFENSPTKRQLFERSPLKREGSMLEIADAIEFLGSDRASFISGTDLLVDGGLAAALTN